jgi:hypothetical protein
MSNDEFLSEKIHSWLETQGYTTEMQVAKTLRKANFDVLQSHYYDDPETGVSREIDVVGRIIDNGGLLEVYSIIECKKSQKPWVLFSSDFSVSNRINSFAVMGEIARTAVSKNIQELIKNTWLRKEGHVAYAITEAFTNKEDIAFKAGLSATKAAIALSKSKNFGGEGALYFYFPTVVFDGQLFECYLDNDGNSIVSEISSTFLNFQIKFRDHQGASIHIVRLDAFENYCKELETTFNQLKQVLKLERMELALKSGMNPNLVED